MARLFQACDSAASADFSLAATQKRKADEGEPNKDLKKVSVATACPIAKWNAKIKKINFLKFLLQNIANLFFQKLFILFSFLKNIL